MQTTVTRKTAWPSLATLAIACAASFTFIADIAQAQSYAPRGSGYSHSGGGNYGGGNYSPRHNHGWRHGGSDWVWGGIGLGLGLGIASTYASPWYYDQPRYVVVNPPTVVYENAPQVVYSQPVPARTSQQPVIYPRNGQSAAKMDADANACSAWAGEQPNATSSSSVFLRGTQACMDARGYTVR